MERTSSVSERVHEPLTGFEALRSVDTYSEDGRRPLHELYDAYSVLRQEFGWRESVVFEQEDEVNERRVQIPILGFRTPQAGPALWVLSGIHGEEPAGPNAIAREIEFLGTLGSKIPMVVLPLCNPKGYRKNWRFPNTESRKYKSSENPNGGVSVTDSDHLLPDPRRIGHPLAERAMGQEAGTLTSCVLHCAERYPPVMVFDHHEDEALAASYVYSQGSEGVRDAVAREVIGIMQRSGVPLQMSGTTRFGEKIVDGVVAEDADGNPVVDGSVDQLLGADTVFMDGQWVKGPGARTVIVIETPTIGVPLEKRVMAHASILRNLERLWGMVMVER